MKYIYRNKIVLVITVILALLCLFINCVNNRADETIVVNNYGDTFAGTSTCRKCHADIYESFVHTAHYTTSRPGEKEYVKGSFDHDKNILQYSYLDRVVMMETDSGLYQSSFYKNTAKQSERIDITVGSGTRGQSYFYWKNHSLFQLPVSYFTPLNNWANSPGNGELISYNRMVYARCMECHSTYIKTEGNSVANYDRTQLIFGVTCENCHGAAGKHVQFHTEHPEEKKGKYIVNTSRLPRQQQLDQCALCHSGTKQNIKPAFSFIPGDTLADYYTEKTKLDSATNQDVHGNKYNLFISSQCFINSPAMTCATCHNTHENERGNVSLFSKKCMSCHTEANHNFCALPVSEGEIIKRNCIDCHMPRRPSTILSVYLPDKHESVAAEIREHRIAIYPEETKKVMLYLKTMRKL